MVHVTKHATKRGRERLGLQKQSVERNAERAYSCGLQHRETTGSLRRYLDSVYLKYKTANAIRIYGDHVYIFNGKKLITVFYLPNKYKSRVRQLFQKKNTEKEDAYNGYDKTCQ